MLVFTFTLFAPASIPGPGRNVVPQSAYFMIVPDDDLYNFWVTVVLAIVGQSVGLVYTIYDQVRSSSMTQCICII